MASISGSASNDRDNQLATFQAATGLEDIETSISVLEQHGWNLAEAINSIMPQSYGIEESRSAEGGSTAPVFASANCSRSQSASPVTPPSHLPSAKEVIISFVWDDGSLPLAIPVNQKIGQIKQDLRHLLNWPEQNKVVISLDQEGTQLLNDELTVEQLSFGAAPDGRLLYVSSQHNNVLPPSYQSLTNNGLCHLTVYLNNRPVELKLSPTTTIEELKKQASRMFGVSADLQKWVGWPSGLPDHTLLQDAGILHGEHQLKLETVDHLSTDSIVSKLSTSNNRVNRPPSISGSTSSGSDQYASAHSDDDDYEVDMDSMTSDTPRAAPVMAPMIPPDCTNPLEALNSFTHQFANRYGPVHPMFFIGSLADAVKEATGGLAATRKPLLLYLHHDRSILSNVFCSQLLCSESIVNYLSLNFICWGWDLTTTQLRDQLLDMVRESFGADAARNVMAVEPDNLPIILIVFKSKGKVEVRNVIQGFTEVDLLMAAMILAVEEHQMAITQDAAEEEQRIAREKMIMEQDQAYQESLAQDKQKAQRAQEEQLAKERVAQAKLQQAMQEEEKKKQLKEQLPAEPDVGAKNVATIRLRCPDGGSLVRRFLSDDKVELLFIYTGSKGYSKTEYKLLSSFPRRDVTTLDASLTFKQAKLFPQETLFVEERTD